MVFMDTTAWLCSLVRGLVVLLLRLRRSTQLQTRFNRHPVNRVRLTPSSRTQLSLWLVLKPRLSPFILLLR